MKTTVFILVALSLTRTVYAGSATWKLNPTDNDWNNAANWTPETVPNDREDIATFDASNIRDISVATDVTVHSMVFNPGASAYSVSANEVTPHGSLTFYSFPGGVINNSGVTQNFEGGGITFASESTAGINVVYTQKSSSDDVSLSLLFTDHSNAGNATLINEGATSSRPFAGDVDFFDTAAAHSSTIINEEGDAVGGATTFWDRSSAGHSTITSYRTANTVFTRYSKADNATLIADGGTISFLEGATGDLATIRLTNGGILDLFNRLASVQRHPIDPMTIGSLEGDNGTVRLGSQQLTIGGNGLSTTYGGLIRQRGSVVKTGDGTLTLTGKSDYRGGTTIEAGSLIVQTAMGSATGTGTVQVNAGTFGGRSNITGAVTLGGGSGPGAFLAPGVNAPGTLAIKNTLTFKADGTYNCELNTDNGRTDRVTVKGVTINSGAMFAFIGIGNSALTVGTVFTAIDNTATTPISGNFINLTDGSIFTANGNTFQVSYEGGDGNDLTLTVVP